MKRNETTESKQVKEEGFWQIRFEEEEWTEEKSESHSIIRSMNKHIIKC